MREPELKWVRLDELHGWPRNPREHDIGDLLSSFEAFGFVAPVLVNAETSCILAGHGRVKALWERFNGDRYNTPEGIFNDSNDDMWLVPCVSVELSEELHEAYLIRDNRSAELGGWTAELTDSLQELNTAGMLELSGFDGDDLDTLLTPLELPTDGEETEGNGERKCPACGHVF
jgi:ParB-like chromosome segregation protein Spo0J